MPVALDDLRRGRLRLEPELLARDALDLGVDRRVVADRARELADPDALERGREPLRSRSSSNAQTASLRPKVVGSAWTPCVRPIVSVSRCSSARCDDRVEGAVDPGQDELAGRADLERERRVDDVRRRQPVVEPAPGRARARRRRRRRTRPGRGASSPRSPRRAPASAPCAFGADLGRRLGRDDADLGPPVERRELDLEPALELALVRPDPGHGRAGVAGDHSLDSRDGLLRVPAALGEDPRREDRRVPRAVDRDARDRHARRHLRDREQRVEPAADALRRAQRDADHRQVAVGGDDPGKRGRHPGAGDDHAHSAELRGRRVLGDAARVAVRREDLQLVRDPALAQLGERRVHRLEVGLGADEDPDERAWLVELLEQADRRRLRLGSAGNVHRLRRDVAPVARALERDHARTPRTRARAPARACRPVRSR